MILTALVPAILLGIIATVLLPTIFGDVVSEFFPIIMTSFAIITIGVTLVIGLNKKARRR